MSALHRALLTLLAVVALGFGLAACGGDDEETASSGSGQTQAGDSAEQGSTGSQIQKDEANAGKTVTVGSKNFPEQYILGEIYAQALQAAGFTVKKELDLGAEQVAFKALKSGTIDMYPEYTGTALTSFYRVKIDDVPRDKDEAFAQLTESLKADSVTAMPQTPFQNTYKVTSTRETAEKYGNPKTLSEVAEKAKSGSSLSGFPECRQRTDCLLGLQDVYKWNPKFVSSQGQYADLDKGQAEFTMGFSTDGPLSLDKYVTYEDDKQLFPPYYVTVLTRDDAVEKLGDSGKKVIEQVQGPLTEDVMRELNSRVSIDKQTPEAVAKAYLSEAGFVPQGS
jgi:glycine betaine/choline ABC-type transport system substrate-binding protein